MLHRKEDIVDKPAELVFFFNIRELGFRYSLGRYVIFGMGEIWLILPLGPCLARISVTSSIVISRPIRELLAGETKN